MAAASITRTELIVEVAFASITFELVFVTKFEPGS